VIIGNAGGSGKNDGDLGMAVDRLPADTGALQRSNRVRPLPPMFTEHPHWQLTDVYAGVILEFPHRARGRVNDQETRLPVHDGLPEPRDPPAEMGGSDLAIAE
jgi:hypothetical protein